MQSLNLKNYILFIIPFLLLSSCSGKLATVKEAGYEEYRIAELAVKHYVDKFNLKEMRLLEQPEAESMYISNWMDGFNEDSLNFKDIKFTFKSPVTKWKPKKMFKDKYLKRKLLMIEDFSKVPEVPLTADSSNTYYSLSNPAFSIDGNFAIIHVSHFSDMIMANLGEGAILVFKRKGNEWEYIGQFSTWIA